MISFLFLKIFFFSIFDSTKEEAVCQQLLAYWLTATTPKAIEEIAAPLLGTCPHFPQSVLLFLEALFMQPEGRGLEERSGGGGRTGAEKWKDVIKENKEVTVQCGSFTQEPFLLLPLTSDPRFSPVFRHGCQKKKKKMYSGFFEVVVHGFEPECVCNVLRLFDEPTQGAVRAFKD